MEIQPSYTVPHIHLSEVKLKLGLKDEARAALIRAIESNPKEEILYTKLIQMSAAGEQLQSAGADAFMALAAIPHGGSGLWHRVLAFSQLQTGARDEALHTVELGLQAFPSDASLERLKALCSQSPCTTL